VQTISRKGSNSAIPEARILRDCTPATSSESPEAKRQSVLHGDVERPAEMIGPLGLSQSRSGGKEPDQ
jgi:hypothetical protein